MRKIKKTLAILTVVLMAFAMVAALSSCELAHTHEITKVAEQPADCENGGVKAHYECSECDKLFTDAEGTKETTKEKLVIAPLGHVERTILGTPATCEDDGLSDGKYCSECDKKIVEQEIIPATGHKEVTNPGFAATCEKDGLTDGVICGNDNCEAVFAAREVIPATGHAWDDGQVSTPATCETKGEKIVTCKNDSSHTQKVEIPALQHNWDEGSVTSSATCTDDGTRVYTCKNDSTHTKPEVIPANGHNAQKTEANPVTCTNNGNIEYWYCQTCDKYFKDADYKQEISVNDTVITAKGHSLALVASGAETQYEIGADFDKANLVVKLDCDNCVYEEIITDYTLSKETNLQASDGQITITYVKGELTYTATYVIVVKHTHNMTFVPAKNATCEETGIVEHYFCSVCGNGYSTESGADSDLIQNLVIPALNHAWSKISYEWSDDNKTCTALKACGNDASHNQSETVNVTVESESADCFKDGYTTYTATFTNAIFEKQIKSEPISGGHNFENGECKNNCGYYCLTLNNATLANNAGTLVDSTTNVYAVKAGTEVVIKADAEPSGKMFVGFDRDAVDNRVEQNELSQLLTFNMGSNPVSYTAVYNTKQSDVIVGSGWTSIDNKYTSKQTGVSASALIQNKETSEYGYTFIINSTTELTDNYFENLLQSNIKTLNGTDRVTKLVKFTFTNKGEFGVTVEFTVSHIGIIASTGRVYVGAGNTVVAYMELPMLVSNPKCGFMVRGIDSGASGSVELDVVASAAKKYTNILSDDFITDDADFIKFVNANQNNATSSGLSVTTPIKDDSHSGVDANGNALSFGEGDNRYINSIGGLQWSFNASGFQTTKADSLAGLQKVDYRYIAGNVVNLVYNEGDEITIYARIINNVDIAGMYNNEFDIFVAQEGAETELVRTTVKLSEDNMETVVKLTFKPVNADGKIYIGAVKQKTVAVSEASKAGVSPRSDYKYNVIMQFAYNDAFGYEAD